jgi:hypothetical protein
VCRTDFCLCGILVSVSNGKIPGRVFGSEKLFILGIIVRNQNITEWQTSIWREALYGQAERATVPRRTACCKRSCTVQYHEEHINPKLGAVPAHGTEKLQWFSSIL